MYLIPLVLVLVLLMTLRYLLPQMSQKQSVQIKIQPDSYVAKLIEMTNQVLVKAHNLVIWKDASEGIGLVSYDAVKTSSDGTAVILFNDFSDIRMSHDTIVIILERKSTPSQEKSVLALSSGELNGQIQRNHKKDQEKEIQIEIRTKLGWVQVSNRNQKSENLPIQFKAKVENKEGSSGLVASSISGDVVLATFKEKLIIQEGEKIEVVANKISNTHDLGADDFKELLPVTGIHILKTDPEVTNVAPMNKKLAKKKLASVNTFKINDPQTGLKTNSNSIEITGMISNDLKAYLNGLSIHAEKNGSFKIKQDLKIGLNFLTFQIVGPGKNQIRYSTLEVTRSE